MKNLSQNTTSWLNQDQQNLVVMKIKHKRMLRLPTIPKNCALVSQINYYSSIPSHVRSSTKNDSQTSNCDLF